MQGDSSRKIQTTRSHGHTVVGKQRVTMEINELITDISPVQPSHLKPGTIKPGEIWEITRQVQSPLALNAEEQKHLYPPVPRAWQFDASNSPNFLPRYVTIVEEPEANLRRKSLLEPPLTPPSKGGELEPEAEDEWQEVLVMLLSVKCDRLSNVDILIPAKISGVGQDLLAETWQVVPMLTCNLSHRVGQRLSRQVYDLLLDVGDAYHGLLEEPPTRGEIESFGLQVGTKLAESDPEVRAFHQQETDWATILEVPVAAYRSYRNALAVSGDLLDITIELEREFPQVKPTVNLSQWLENTLETIQQGWQLLDELMPSRNPEFAFRRTPTKSATEVSRGMAIEFENEGEAETFILAIFLRPNPQEIEIILRLYPMGDRVYLPENIQMAVLDEAANSLLDAFSKSSDEFIQIKLDGLPGEQFGVQVEFGKQSITKNFVI